MADGNGMEEVELHPWNIDFRWQCPEGPYRRLTTAQAARFDRDGYVVLEAVFSAAEIAAVTAETDEVEAQVDAFLKAQPEQRYMIAESGAITFSPHLVTRSPVLREFARHRVFADLCADLVGPDVNLYWDQAVYKKPEKPRRFPWHQDNGYTFIEPQQYLTCWVALTDATVDSGCPWVVPGMHRRGTLRHTYLAPLGYECFAEAPTAVAAPVAAGGIVVFSSLTPHLTGPNLTRAVRKAYILQYSPTGARLLVGDPEVGPSVESKPCDDPDRQFAIVREGERVRGDGAWRR